MIVTAALAMAAGTYAGGWRIIRTLDQRVAKIDPPQGFAAQTATAGVLWTTAHFGFPVSTTHTVSGSVIGAGAFRGVHAVRWGVAGNILVAWVLTIPMAGLVGAGIGNDHTDPRGRRARGRARRRDRGQRVPRSPLGHQAATPRRGDLEGQRQNALLRASPILLP